VTEDPVVRERMVEKRAQKLALAAGEIPIEEEFRVYGAPYATLTVVSWRSNKGAILEAFQRLADVENDPLSSNCSNGTIYHPKVFRLATAVA
jgi:pyruvate/2-oxoacid:ferredoxin oxidoreductase alpha subunit